MNQKQYYIYQMNLKELTILSFFLLLISSIPCFFLEIEITESIFMYTCFLMIPWLILHELLHSIAYVMYGASFQNITYGMCLEKSILYCLCKQNISKKNILHSLLFPFFWIGFITYLLGILFGNVTLILLSLLNISGCAGDFVMFFFLLRLKNIEFSEFDDPTAFGIYTKEPLENKKVFGLTLIETSTSLKRTDFKKVRISTASIYILIALLLLFSVSFICNFI